MTDVLDGFCGVGVGLGLAELGLTEHGIDSEPSVAETRERLGMSTTLADITTLDPHDWAGVEGCWFSPPCTDYSRAGKGLGLVTLKPLAKGDVVVVFGGKVGPHIGQWAAGAQTRPQVASRSIYVINDINMV